MPLLKRKPFSLTPRPRDLGASEKVFLIPFTGEVFRTYEEYLERITLYRQRVWTCRFTGKSNLTFEEALISERQACQAIREFPQAVIDAVATFVHHREGRLADLVDEMATQFSSRFFEGERVTAPMGGKRAKFTVRAVLPDNQYELEPEEGGGGAAAAAASATDPAAASGGRVRAAASDISRVRLLSRETLRRLLTAVAGRTRIQDKQVWAVEAPIATRLGLEEPFRPESDAALPAETPARPSGSAAGAAGAAGAGAGDKGPAARGKRKAEEDGNSAADASAAATAAAGAGASGAAAAVGGEAKRAKPLIRRYPMEDRLLTPEELAGLPPRPAPRVDMFPLSGPALGYALQTWTFCRSFPSALKLSPFSLDDMLAAMQHERPLTLTEELFGRLMTACGKKPPGVPWAPALKHLLRAEPAFAQLDLAARFDAGGFMALTVADRVRVAAWLASHALRTETIRSALEKNMEKLEDLRRTTRELDMAGRQRIKELEAAEKGDTQAVRQAREEEEAARQKRAEALEREAAKRAVRIEPLGRDRDGAEYFVFPGDPRVFVRRGEVWGCYATGEELSALHASLSDRGVHEHALRQAVEALPPLPTQESLAAAAAAAAAQFSPIATRRSTRNRGGGAGGASQPAQKQEAVPYTNTYAKQ